jgi:hypothetical protein
MTDEDEEFNRIEREASLRKAAVSATVSKREWVGLTDEDVKDLCGEASNFGTSSWIRHIEAKLKEKNT